MTGPHSDLDLETWAKLDEVVKSLEADVRAGLTDVEASRRLAHGRNELPSPPRESLGQRIWSHVREPMSLLLMAAALVSLVALRHPRDAAAITAIVVINIVIAMVQEERAESALEALRSAAAPTAVVMRSGRPITIPAAEAVPGDVVLLAAGDRVAADLWITDSWSLEADESALTGESLAVMKTPAREGDMSLPLGDRTWLSYAGTVITAGSGRGLVIATGPHTQVGRVASHLEKKSPPTPLQKQLASLSARLGQAAIAIALIVFFLILFRLRGDNEALEQAFLGAVALAVAAVPEGLPTVVTLSLALGVRRMARHGAIVRNLPAVETLGSTTALLTDKTGTLTQNRLQMSEIIGGEAEATLGVPTSAMPDHVLRVCALCNDATVDPPQGDPVEIALLEAFDPIEIQHLRETAPRVGNLPFDSRRKMMSTLHEVAQGFELLTKGAPEAVLAASEWILTDRRGERRLTEQDRSRLLGAVDGLAAAGSRVLALATRTFDERPLDLAAAEKELVFVALVALHDPLRAEAADTVKNVTDAGVRLVMVTGDHVGTASAVARSAGLTHNDGEVLTGTQIRTNGLPNDLHSVRVYARVDPEQKLDLVEAFQLAGHVVAVTGDGVNDAPALRRADIGVAMGRGGSQVAREAADLVITDDDLNLVTRAIREGRGIYDNIRKVIDYLVAGNLSEISVLLAGLAFFPDLGIPLFPLQLLWINLLTDGLPALALGFDHHREDLLYRPTLSSATKLLSARRLAMLGSRALVLAGGAIAALIAVRGNGGSWEEARTAMFTALVAAHLLYAYVVRLPLGSNHFNPRLAAAAGAGLLLQVGTVLGPFRDIFGVVAIDSQAWLAAALGGLLPVALLALVVQRGR
jgi:Ca2+-transporting ATPase